jgi:hypothetical protein
MTSLMLRNELIPIDRLSGERQAQAGEGKRLGDQPVVIELASGGATVEVVSRAEDRDLVTGPMTVAS